MPGKNKMLSPILIVGSEVFSGRIELSAVPYTKREMSGHPF
ncbi:MAG: hypothetical protein O8C66_08375 [Candidatus Methanoperedens sp.]|nr:hypothetical protein [Candidatus Methanoperedens sp.]MCZ7370512.1 hypothetical protein [Candidatus Methanoperedens sp.]